MQNSHAGELNIRHNAGFHTRKCTIECKLLTNNDPPTEARGQHCMPESLDSAAKAGKGSGHRERVGGEEKKA